MSISWKGLVAFAVTLPEVAQSTSYGTPALKVAGTLMGRLRTDSEGGLALKCSTADKEALLAGADTAFYTTPHYDGYNYILVNLDLVDADELFELVTDAWRIAAPARLQKKSPHEPEHDE